MAAHEFVLAQERLLRRLTDSLPVGIAQADSDGLIVLRNQRLTAILGRANATTIAELFACLAAEDHNAFDDAVAAALTGTDSDLEVDACQDSATPLRCHLTLRALDDGNGVIVCVEDITDRARLRDELDHRATFDALTECHNRASTLHEVHRALTALATGNSHGVTVVFIDLDGFKAVNDRHGHAAGDEVLRRVGGCLRDAMRSSDIVGRIGGDEFLVLSTATNSCDQAMALGDRVADAVAATIGPSPGHRVAASFGIAWTGPHDLTPHAADDLISRADAAMYESKRNGDGRPVHATAIPSPLGAGP